MRHRKAGLKLNRTGSHRQAMFRNMVTSLFKYERIRTTDAKAKELKRWADSMITLAKRGDLHARRQALAIIREKAVVHSLFEEASARYGHINGGYTRVIKLARRPGDAAPVSIVELISAEKPEKKGKKSREAKDRVEAKAEETPAPAGQTDSPGEAGESELSSAPQDASGVAEQATEETTIEETPGEKPAEDVAEEAGAEEPQADRTPAEAAPNDDAPGARTEEPEK